MVNFPVEEMSYDWWVKGEGSMGKACLFDDIEFYDILLEEVQLIPNHLYKWDKKTVPPVAEGVKWVAFDETFINSKEGFFNRDNIEYWKDGTLKYFMIVEDDQK